MSNGGTIPHSSGGLRPELVRALTLYPGSTARQLVHHLQTRGLQAFKTNVNSVLYADRGTFWNDCGAPPKWQVMSGAALPPPPVVRAPPVRAASPFALYAWQAEALVAWRAHGRQGVVEAVTGTGKTMVGLAAAWEELQEGGKVQVLVPSVELLNQWAGLVEQYFPRRQLGLLGGGYHDTLSNVDILVAVVNSARDGQVHAGRGHALLVADECHRYASPRNAGALDARVFQARLGLSATYARLDDGHLSVLDPFFSGTCYEMGYPKAVADEVTAHFKVALVSVAFTSEERLEYVDMDERARRLRSRLIKFAGVREDPFGSFMEDVAALAQGGHGVATVKARAYLNAFSRRRQLLAETGAKRNLLNSLVPAIRGAERVLVFTETKEAAEDAASVLAGHGVRAAATHSGLPSHARRALLSQFAQGSLAVLCAPRILDEGVDVPAADLGIILAASQSRRQMIQRMGRVLRRKADGRFARFVIAYVIDTSEDPDRGAHGTFLEEITDVANDVTDFRDDDSCEEVCEYLNDFAWDGPILSPRMAIGH